MLFAAAIDRADDLFSLIFSVGFMTGTVFIYSIALVFVYAVAT
jgi:hypothetical protein